MRIVFDTNVASRAIRSGSLAAKLLSRIVTGQHILVFSPFLLSEIARALRYPRMLTMHGLDNEGIDAFVMSLQIGAFLVNPGLADIVPVVQKDPDDDHVIAAAVVGKTEVICTRDSHFDEPVVRAYCQQHGIRILSDLALLEELEPPATE
jgi:putative PIN family toxin of toxin-antitoxin system